MIIYKLTSPSNKIYIGKSKTTLETRFKQHVNLWKRLSKDKSYKNTCTKLFYAFDKYDPTLWEKEVLVECENEDMLNEKEIYYISFYNSISDGYNITKGGERRCVEFLDDTHKENISVSRKKYFETEDGKRWKDVLSKRFSGNNNPVYSRVEEIKEQNSKWYLIITPQKDEVVLKNLSEFCRDNGLSITNMNRSCSKQQVQTSGGYRVFVLQNYDNLDNTEKSQLINQAKSKIVYKKIKLWIAISPTGVVYEFNNLRKFSISKNINPQNLGDVALGKLKSIKGWKCFSIEKFI